MLGGTVRRHQLDERLQPAKRIVQPVAPAEVAGWPARPPIPRFACLDGPGRRRIDGMYRGNGQSPPFVWGKNYSIASSLDAIRGVPIQVWASKSFADRWLGQVDVPGLQASLRDDRGEILGTITSRLKSSTSQGVVLEPCFLVYGDWAYEIGALRPGEPAEIGPSTRRVSLSTFFRGESMDFNETSTAARGPYDRGSRDMAYVLKAMMFYDASGGQKRIGMANDYQGFADLSGLLKTGRAVLVGMPPQDGSCRGGELLRGPVPKPGELDNREPLGNALDRHVTVYRFVLPVATQGGADN